jgi:ABC-2 type transport system ATP-binding protein
VRGLRKIYRSPEVVANDGISFTVDAGSSFGLLGPNGAGKSTLVKQLVGLLEPTAGTIQLFGEAVRSRRGDRRIARHVSYLPQGSLALGEFRVGEALRWTAMLRGCDKATAATEAGTLMEELGLSGLDARQVRKLSGGQRRLTQLAMSLVGRLPIVILDEPTADIDPALRARIWSLLSERARGGTAVILVTHDVAEAEHVLDNVAILDSGRVVAQGSPAELKAKLSHRTRVELVVAESALVDPGQVGGFLGPESTVDGRRVSAWVPAEDAIPTLEKVMASSGAEAFEDVHLVTPTLEDVYLQVSGRRFEEER